jgi:hypothetical protein
MTGSPNSRNDGWVVIAVSGLVFFPMGFYLTGYFPSSRFSGLIAAGPVGTVVGIYMLLQARRKR